MTEAVYSMEWFTGLSQSDKRFLIELLLTVVSDEKRTRTLSEEAGFDAWYFKAIRINTQQLQADFLRMPTTFPSRVEAFIETLNDIDPTGTLITQLNLNDSVQESSV